MTVIEYIKRKNKIIFDVTGVTLVPESQIVEVVTDNDLGLSYNDRDLVLILGDVCPYCQTFYVQDNTTDERCFADNNEYSECPMSIAGNKCREREDSTWWKASEIWRVDASIPDIEKLESLVKEYNNTLGEK